ncbi:MAG: 50S ribosomal protein L25 [Thermoanaerobaculia bacterium]
MSDTMTIEVQPRETTGKNANRRSRAAGKIPAVVYGGGKESVAIEVDRKTLLDMLKGHAGENPIFLLKLGEKDRHAMIRHMDINPLSRQVIHVDFQRVLMDQKVRVAVPVELTGIPVGVKVDGGMLDFVTREVHVECLPGQIPKHLEFDVSEMRIGQHVEAKDLQLPEGVVLLDEADKVLASISQPQVEEEAEVGADRAEPEVVIKKKGEA